MLAGYTKGSWTVHLGIVHSPGLYLGEEYMHGPVCMLETDTEAMLSGAEWARKVRIS